MYNKSLSIIACAALAVLSASCSKESVTGTDGEAGVSFTIEVPGAPATKAIGDGETAKTLYYQVFDSEGKAIEGLGVQGAKLETKTATVKFQLIKEQDYTFVFWAQTKEPGYYTIGADGLKTITANYTDKSANDENFDAFYAVEKLTVTGPVSKEVTLKRPFAQINIATEGTISAGTTTKDINFEGAASTVTVKGVPTVFSPLAATADIFSEAKEVTFAEAAAPEGNITVNGKDYKYLAVNYVFAPAEGTVYDITASLKVEGKSVSLSVPAVPAKQNWRTNIVGDLLTSGADFTVVVDPVFEGDVSPQTGYKDKNGVAESLPTAPKVVGNVMNVTAANAQYTLDGAYGSISGKTINFTESITEPLVFARPTKYYGSNTKYMVGGFDSSAANYQEFATAEEIAAYKARTDIWTPYCCYARTINDVKFTADTGVTVAGFEFYTGHVYQATDVPHDCVRDGYFANGTNDGYYCSATIKNVTFEGIDFVASVDIQNSRPETDFDGLTFKDCSFTTGITDKNYTPMNKGMCIRIGNWSIADNNKVFKNLVVEKCTFKESLHGVYCNSVYGVKVTESTFTDLHYPAVSLQGGDASVPYGVSEISGNTFTNISDRVIRINKLSAETELTIKDNVSTNSGQSVDGKLSVIKAQGLEDGIVYHISNNNWNGGTGIVENEELKDKE